MIGDFIGDLVDGFASSASEEIKRRWGCGGCIVSLVLLFGVLAFVIWSVTILMA